MPQPDDSGVLASSTPPEPDRDPRIDAARIVAEHWRSASLDRADASQPAVITAHVLNCVLAALDGETDPAELGVDQGPDAEAIRRVAVAAPERPQHRRREWVAALRHGAADVRSYAGTVANPETCAAMLDETADRIESGELTPWADTPTVGGPDHDGLTGQRNLARAPVAPTEPAVELAPDEGMIESSGHGEGIEPAAQPDSPAILGRALLASGRVWLAYAPGQWTRNPREHWRTDEIADHYGEATEVLLVSPAAGRVLEAVRRWAAVWSRVGGVDEAGWLPACQELAAAHYAMVGDCQTPNQHTRQQTPGFVGQPSNIEPTPPIRPLDGLGWGRHADEEREQIAENQRLGIYGPAAPGDGPGWDRDLIDDAIRELPGPLRLQVEALLADRDRLADRLEGVQLLPTVAEHIESVEQERDAARAELARLRGELATCVWIDPRRQSGAACIGGFRLTAGLIAGLLGDGLDGDAIRGLYPEVTDGHLAAVRAWQAQVDRLRADHLLIPRAGVVGYRVRLPLKDWEEVHPSRVEIVVRSDLGQEGDSDE